MNVYLDCIPCFLRQALQTARFVTSDEEKQEEVVRAVLAVLQTCDFRKTPPEIAHQSYYTTSEVLGVTDPYDDVKKESNALVCDMYKTLEKDVKTSDDPVGTSIRLAIAGNIMDYAARSHFDIHETVNTVKTCKMGIDHTEELKRDLKTATVIAYIVDNAGEIVFDKLVIETVNTVYGAKKWHVFVKGQPIINDATIKDADQIGLTAMDTVTVTPLTMDKEYDQRTDPQFIATLKKADVVISKGQGNYEILSNAGTPLYFLLMVKCPVVAEDMNASVNDIVVLNKK